MHRYRNGGGGGRFLSHVEESAPYVAFFVKKDASPNCFVGAAFEGAVEAAEGEGFGLAAATDGVCATEDEEDDEDAGEDAGLEAAFFSAAATSSAVASSHTSSVTKYPRASM